MDNLASKKSSVIQVACSVLVIVTAIPSLLSVPEDPVEEDSERIPSLMESPKFWLVVHVFCSVAVALHGRIADARFGAADRLFYAYGFRLVSEFAFESNCHTWSSRFTPMVKSEIMFMLNRLVEV